MGAPEKAFQPYASSHSTNEGPGDARPTAVQVVKDEGLLGKLTDKVVLITGATRGIGIETARAMYETGAHLFLGGRDMSQLQHVIDDIVAKAEVKDAPKPEALELHLDSLDGVKKAAADFKQRSKQLNILINNAGVMATPFGHTKDGFETQFGTNHLAHFLLFQQLKPLLLESAAKSGTTSRVVNVSSAGHRRSEVDLEDPNFKSRDYEKFTAYGQSKTANIWMANELDRRYGSQNLHATSVHPGMIMTWLGRHMDEKEVEMLGLRTERVQKMMKSPEQGAATTVWAAVGKHFEGNGGVYLADVGEAASDSQVQQQTGGAAYAAHAYSEEKEKKLWKMSCEAVGVADD